MAKKVVVMVLLLWLLCFSLLFVEHGSSWLFQIGGNVEWIAVCLANLLHFHALCFKAGCFYLTKMNKIFCFAAFHVVCFGRKLLHG